MRTPTDSIEAAEDRLNLWIYFEENVFRLPENEECIWSREGCYTWRQVYDQSNRYSQFLLSHGVKKGELVGFYLTNSPEFVFAWLGTWGIGTAPAMINYHLAGEALIHCVKLAGIKVLLVLWSSFSIYIQTQTSVLLKTECFSDLME